MVIVIDAAAAGPSPPEPAGRVRAGEVLGRGGIPTRDTAQQACVDAHAGERTARARLQGCAAALPEYKRQEAPPRPTRTPAR